MYDNGISIKTLLFFLIGSVRYPHAGAVGLVSINVLLVDLIFFHGINFHNFLEHEGNEIIKVNL